VFDFTTAGWDELLWFLLMRLYREKVELIVHFFIPWKGTFKISERVKYDQLPVLQNLRVRIPYKPEFFLGFLFASEKVAFIAAVIFFTFNF